jgi:hypothetical protein
MIRQGQGRPRSLVTIAAIASNKTKPEGSNMLDWLTRPADRLLRIGGVVAGLFLAKRRPVSRSSDDGRSARRRGDTLSSICTKSRQAVTNGYFIEDCDLKAEAIDPHQ